MRHSRLWTVQKRVQLATSKRPLINGNGFRARTPSTIPIRAVSRTAQLASPSIIPRIMGNCYGSRALSTVPIIYVEADGTEREVQAEIGNNLLQIAHDNDIELEGACGGELACSTCHLIFPQEIYETLPEMDEEEEDMLDMAFELTETSRLGCQICAREDFAGMKVRIPDDGF